MLSREQILFPFIRAIGGIIYWIPFNWACLSGRILALFLAPFAKIVRHHNQAISPKLSFKKGWILRYKKCVARIETQTWRYRKKSPIKKEEVSLLYPERLDACLKQKRGLILVSVHHYYHILFFSWINQLSPNFQPYLMKNFFPKEKPLLSNFLHRRHDTLFQGRLIHTSSDLRKPVEILRKGGAVILLQDLFNEKGEQIQFLGRKVRNPLGAIRLAKISGSIILPSITTHQLFFPKKKWVIHFWKPIDPNDSQPKENLISSMEEMIKTYPETWGFWPLMEEFQQLPPQATSSILRSPAGFEK